MKQSYLKNYCIVGLGKVEDVKEDLTAISETSINFVSGDGLIIATFTSAFHIGEIEEMLKTNGRSYILFEMTPGYFSANIENKEFQTALFGSIINNGNPHSKMEEALNKIREGIKNGNMDDMESFMGEDLYVEKTDTELLEEAIENEDYEKAAKLRDKINK
jgi:cellobiose-specific phosphotransferase system component IIA